MPQIPVPKPRTKARYSLVLINEAGYSRQIELTRARLIAVGGAVAAVALALVMVIVFSGRSTVSQPGAGLQAKIQALQNDLNKKDLALAEQEKRVKELEKFSLSSATPQSTTDDLTRQLSEPEVTPADEPRLGAVSENANALKRKEFAEKAEPQNNTGRLTMPVQSGPKKPSVEAALPGLDLSEPLNKQAIVNFNAQDVTAVSDGDSGGTLSFRLVKDHPDLRFSGYLFVFVEMTDQRGEQKIYVYPKAARLGDEDLPADYREGETLSFKYNSRVELPYGDIRSGASLARVSILLYGDNGKIVFQRGFERKEVRNVSAKPPAIEGAKHKSSEKRRAL